MEITKIERDKQSLVSVRAPACFKGLVSFPSSREDAKVEALSGERVCLSYSKHRAGLLPRGLQEFLMLEDIRRREDERDEAQRAWQERQEDKQIKRQFKDSKRMIFAIIGAAVVGAIITAVSVLLAGLQHGG